MPPLVALLVVPPHGSGDVSIMRNNAVAFVQGQVVARVDISRTRVDTISGFAWVNFDNASYQCGKPCICCACAFKTLHVRCFKYRFLSFVEVMALQ